ncbi:MAG: phosphate starvation-inducible protein PsiF [Nitrospira sp.]|nr:phosphate starvation-inducible protein PsiF [Nitrospira sp.]MBH0187978.1 phosphate starvation-inducible protein PsiF [Nitrospira sp.]MBH0196927.1 phosphate starvation-inducible protein PsiF [Nitrospira sp.]
MYRAIRALTLTLFVLRLGMTPFAVAEPDRQNKMNACNEQANAKRFGEGKGGERKAFMKECLSAKSEKSGGGKGTQQNKMKTCNKEAGDKKLLGDERKKFMSDCLSNESASNPAA